MNLTIIFDAGLLCVLVIYILAIHGAVPGVSLPTLGQAVWLTGFAESMSSGPLISLYADDFGIPKPAAIAFGLSGAFPCAVLIEFGMQPVNAYALVIATWLMVAFASAIWFCVRLGMSRRGAMLMAAVWITLPIIWTHANYSMLSIGFALIPAYSLAALRLLDPYVPAKRSILWFVLACVLSIFTDGYTFIMFAAAFAIFFLVQTLCDRSSMKRLLVTVAPASILGFGGAYLLYSIFTGFLKYQSDSLDFFRGWGADIYYMLKPTKGILPFFDGIGFSTLRPQADHFGDSSVYWGTFLVPLLIMAALSGIFLRRTQLKYAFAACAVAGIYMSMGPSIKINSHRLPGMSATIPAEASGFPTGTGFLSAHVPGFKQMRASYRWIVLGQFGLWALGAAWLGDRRRSGHSEWTSYIFPSALLVVSAPSVGHELASKKGARTSYERFVDDTAFLEGELKGMKVAFLPYGNDFAANLLAPLNGFKTYNIGGDKNLSAARKFWPEDILSASDAVFTPLAGEEFRELLSSNTVDAIVVPDFNMLWDVHQWPPTNRRTAAVKKLADSLASDAYLEIKRYPLALIVKRGPAMTDYQGSATQNEFCAGEKCWVLPASPEYGFHSQSGIFDESGVLTHGAPGFAIFGPYFPLRSGDYILDVYGTIFNEKNVVIEIDSSNGKSKHAHKQVSRIVASDAKKITSIPFSLEQDVTDLEIRVYGDLGLELRIERLVIRRVKSD
tara:strand:+ start:2382 stop:4562 length:2181 start_codon:yes stop_codon:yes gene_type:complete